MVWVHRLKKAFSAFIIYELNSNVYLGDAEHGFSIEVSSLTSTFVILLSLLNKPYSEWSGYPHAQ